jgi:hypothetical protein
MTKVQALVALFKDQKGKATWSDIYNKIERYYPQAKASTEWKAGLRGVLYREMRKGHNFKQVGKGTFALK